MTEKETESAVKPLSADQILALGLHFARMEASDIHIMRTLQSALIECKRENAALREAASVEGMKWAK